LKERLAMWVIDWFRRHHWITPKVHVHPMREIAKRFAKKYHEDRTMTQIDRQRRVADRLMILFPEYSPLECRQYANQIVKDVKYE
jgi:hypothetical protein